MQRAVGLDQNVDGISRWIPFFAATLPMYATISATWWALVALGNVR